MRDGNHANSILKGYFKEQAYPQLFAKGGNVMQIDATMGMTAAISEMLVQSNLDVIDILPALPDDWEKGEFKGVCTAGAFELDIKWVAKKVTEVKILSKQGEHCHLFTGNKITVEHGGKKVKVTVLNDGSYKFQTQKNETYIIRPI